MAIDVFIAYAREDGVLLHELHKHLSSLHRQGLINTWFDGDIVEGTEWRAHLLDHLHSAQVILLLISPDFIASRFCYDVEMAIALRRHEENEARVIPVLLRPVEWYGLPFARIQAAPGGGKPVTLWDDRDAAFLDVTRRIRKSMRELLAKPEGREREKTPMKNDTTQKSCPAVEQSRQPSSVPWTIKNYIGTVSDHSTVYQGNEQATITHGTVSAEDGGHEYLLDTIADLVDKTNELYNQHKAQQKDVANATVVQLDPAYLKWFMDVMWEIKQRAVPIPDPLLLRVQEVCQRLRIPCFLTQ